MATVKATLNGKAITAESAELEAVAADLNIPNPARLLNLAKQLSAKWLERDDLSKGMLVALLTGYNLFAGGAPGTGKTEMSRDLISAFTGRSFYYLLGADTRADELLGSIDLGALENNETRRDLDGKLADVHLAVLDEIFKCNSASLNLLLGLILDKQVVNGKSVVNAPLVSMFGLSNELPDDDEDSRLQAFWNRIPLRYWVDYVSPRSKKELRMRTVSLKKTPQITERFTIEELEQFQAMVKSVRVGEHIIDLLDDLERRLQDEGIRQSDRVCVSQVMRVLQAYALLHGSDVVIEDHIEILKAVYWSTLEEKPKVEKAIKAILDEKNRELEEKAKTAAQIIANLKNVSNSESKVKLKFALHAANSKLSEMLAELEAVMKNAPKESSRSKAAHQVHENISRLHQKEVIAKLAEIELA